jgi:ABC-type transport system substrate-binding protein
MEPSPTNLVWPVARHQIDVTWDPDVAHAGREQRPAPYHTLHLVYEPLTTPRIAEDAEGVRYPISEEVQPRLAVAWEPADGYRTWTVHLRRGVRSHFGNELCADDVVWAWQRVYALRGVGLWRSRRMAGVESAADVEALDRSTVRFRTTGPNPEFPQYLIFATNNVVDSSEARRHADANDPWAVEWLSDNIAGFGAFTLEAQTSSELRFSARDDYWAGRPGLETVTMVGVACRNDAMRLLEQGEANFLPGLYPEEYARFANRPGYRLVRVRANHATLEFNWLAPPFDDQRVRQAICYALPYQRIREQVYHGYARPSLSPIPSVSKYSTGEFWRYETDLATARRLLRESGYPDGFETQLYIQPSCESLRFGEIVREALKELGITVEVRLQTSLPFGTKVPMWFREECGHALYDPMYDLGHDYDPPPGMWGGKNIVHPMWTEKMAAIRNAPSAEQPERYRAIQREILEFAPCAHIAEVETGWVVREPVDDWALGPLFLGAQTTVWSAHRQIFGWW